MEQINAYLVLLPPWAYAVAGGLLVLVLAAVAARIVLRRRFQAALWEAMQAPHRAGQLLKERYPARALLRRTRLVENFAEKFGHDIIALSGIDELWIKRLAARKGRRDFQRVLIYAPDKGLFQCFLAALEKSRLAPDLKRWIDASGDFLPLRRLAYAGRGRAFDGRKGYAIFSDKVDLLREMMGDPEWPARYFAAKILVHDEDERTRKALLQSLRDSHPLVRKTVIQELRVTEQRESFYLELFQAFTTDPAYEIRKTAWDRTHREFMEFYALDSKGLDDDAVFHVLELLRPGMQEDESFAMTYLESDDLELRLPAAQFLDRVGALARLFHDVHMGDRKGLKRNLELLEKAGEVNTVGFLAAVEGTDNPASMLVCAKILASHAHLGHLTTTLARKTFSIDTGSKELEELYRAVLACIAESGDDGAMTLLDAELKKHGAEEGRLNMLLEAMPPRSAPFCLDTLIAFLETPGFPAYDALRGALGRMPRGLVLPRVTEIVKRSREECPHSVKMAALRVLGEMELPYCLQLVLENMPVLPPEEARDFMAALTNYPKPLLREKLGKYINSSDSNIRASIITALPLTGETSLAKMLQSSMKDADPDVRIATIWALVEFKDSKLLDDQFNILRDPVERVRIEAARALGRHGSDKALQKFNELLQEDEVLPVKAAAVEGLAYSGSAKAVDLLVDRLGQDDLEPELLPPIIAALARKTQRREVEKLLDQFKDADPRLKERLTESFKAMGDDGAEIMLELLKEDIPSLKPFITEVLETTGYVESRIRLLSHREPVRRREAAQFLSVVGTHAAFRGIVMAARDPDDEVRVLVIKALERLETKDGKTLLKELENDPERRVRKYTHWALERLRAKAL